MFHCKSFFANVKADFRSVTTIPAKQYTVLFFRLTANTQTSLLAPYSNPLSNKKRRIQCPYFVAEYVLHSLKS